MKRVRVKNPQTTGRLAIVNSSPKILKGKSTSVTRKRRNNRQRNNPEWKGMLVQSIAAACGGMLVTTAAGKLPLPANPYLNIFSKFALSYGAAYVAEKFKWTAPYAMAVGIGGASVAASDAIKIAIPSLRTIFLAKGQEPVKVVTQTDAVTGEPVAVADAVGWDELGDVVTVNEQLLSRNLGEVIEELDDIYDAEDFELDDIITPEWQPPVKAKGVAVKA